MTIDEKIQSLAREIVLDPYDLRIVNELKNILERIGLCSPGLKNIMTLKYQSGYFCEGETVRGTTSHAFATVAEHITGIN